ncbi:MAG: 3-dehydroquinate synthase [Treponema sp.]|nr:3-dehydroquinate synthase [Treponema sp.]
MINTDYTFNFSGLLSRVRIGWELPGLGDIIRDISRQAEGQEDARPVSRCLLVCDKNTLPIARAVARGGTGDAGGETPGAGGQGTPICVLSPGEERKNWASAEQILRSAREAGLGRDGLFVAVGGGVVSDLAGFAASVYMRGTRLSIVSTSLLGMVDAALGGKTGFDLFGIKNLAGTFFPARCVYLPLNSLRTLPPAEWKSGMAELLKTAVLDGEAFFALAASLNQDLPPDSFSASFPEAFIRRLLEGGAETFTDCLSRAIAYKGRVVESDPRESGTRALLNLGHTFAHALESAAGLGRLSHGEAVAWGIIRACELGVALGLTPLSRAEAISRLFSSYGYETAAPHPLMGDVDLFLKALGGDKKRKGGGLVFIVPAAAGALETKAEVPPETSLLRDIVTGKLRRPASPAGLQQ